MYAYFYEQAAVPDDAEVRGQVRAVAEFMLDSFECIWDHSGRYRDPDRLSWRSYIASTIDDCKVLRELYDEYHVQLGDDGWYPSLARLFAERDREAAATRP